MTVNVHHQQNEIIERKARLGSVPTLKGEGGSQTSNRAGKGREEARSGKAVLDSSQRSTFTMPLTQGKKKIKNKIK